MRIRGRVSREDGFTLIEVMASALVVVLVSASSLIALANVTRSSYDDRARSEAQALAQQNENKLRGLNITELSNLNQTLPAITLDGTSFTIKETASYVTASTGTPSCTNPSADYLQTTSTVTWPRMDGAAPVVVTGQLTPTVGSVSANNGGLAVSALNASGAGDAGMNVTLSGTSTASGTTASDGCALFGDIPPGAYTASVSPPVGTYVDGKTGQAVSATNPDVASTTVNPGTTPASLPFSLDVPGSIAVSFNDAFPVSGLSAPVTPTAPAVVAFNTNMTGVQYRVCTPADNPCPAVGNPDPSFPASDWSSVGGTVTANTMFPYTSPYSVYPGMCSADNPNLASNGGIPDQTSTVTANVTSTMTFTLPAMVVKVWTGTSASNAGSEEALPSGWHVGLDDTGCNIDYSSANDTAATLSSGQAALPLNATYPALGTNDTGILEYPGMPYGSYTSCIDNGTHEVVSASPVTNTGSGEVINLYAGSVASSTTTGTC